MKTQKLNHELRTPEILEPGEYKIAVKKIMFLMLFPGKYIFNYYSFDIKQKGIYKIKSWLLKKPEVTRDRGYEDKLKQ